jgi:hypothetical protein
MELQLITPAMFITQLLSDLRQKLQPASETEEQAVEEHIKYAIEQLHSKNTLF